MSVVEIVGSGGSGDEPVPVADSQQAMGCCQLALSTSDIARSHWWYRQALGFSTAGERRHREGGHWAEVAGLPEAEFDVWCLVGTRPFSQIEMFEFARPRPRPISQRHGPLDLGYSMFGIRVDDMDEALDRIACVGGAPLTEPMDEEGARRVCLRDPDGILVELMEDRVLEPDAGSSEAQGGPSIEFVTVSVRSIDLVRGFWIDVLGLDELRGTQIHLPGHERLWGCDRAPRERIVLSGGGIALEFVRYPHSLRRPRPAGYLISDVGVLNVALGSTDRARFDAAYGRAVAAGYEGHRKPWTLPDVATVVYLRDPQGMSVELLHVQPEALERMGFLPARQQLDRVPVTEAAVSST